MKIVPTGKVTLKAKTPGPHGKSVELAKITRSAPEVTHEHKVTDATVSRYKGLGGVPNRKARRAYAKARRVLVPRVTLTPYEKP